MLDFAATVATDDEKRANGLVSFFLQLRALEHVLRGIVNDAGTAVHLTLRGAHRETVTLDFSQRPLSVQVSAPPKPGCVQVAADVDVLHRILLGELRVGVALGRRDLLLRGSPSELVKLLPLFDFAPLLYPEHLARANATPIASSQETTMEQQVFNGDDIPLAQHTMPERVAFAALQLVSYGLGYAVGALRARLLRNLSLYSLLSAMSRGLKRAASQQSGT